MHKIIHDLATTGGANLPSGASRPSICHIPGAFSHLSTSLYHIYITDGTYNPFPSFAFTGTVKPVYPLSPKRAVPDHIPRPDYVAAGGKCSPNTPPGRMPTPASPRHSRPTPLRNQGRWPASSNTECRGNPENADCVPSESSPDNHRYCCCLRLRISTED